MLEAMITASLDPCERPAGCTGCPLDGVIWDACREVDTGSPALAVLLACGVTVGTPIPEGANDCEAWTGAPLTVVVLVVFGKAFEEDDAWFAVCRDVCEVLVDVWSPAVLGLGLVDPISRPAMITAPQPGQIF